MSMIVRAASLVLAKKEALNIAIDIDNDIVVDEKCVKTTTKKMSVDGSGASMHVGIG